MRWPRRLPYRLRQVDRDGTATLSQVVAVDLGGAPEFVLQGAVPNPFRRVATVRYVLPESGRVCLEVFDMLGRKVRTLVDERQGVGRHEVHFSGEGLPSGMYIYRLRAGGRAGSQRAMILR